MRRRLQVIREAPLGASVKVQVRRIQVKGSHVTHDVILAMWLEHVQ